MLGNARVNLEIKSIETQKCPRKLGIMEREMKRDKWGSRLGLETS